MKNLQKDEQILSNMANGVCLIRISDGIIVYTNAKFEKLFGYNHDELLGMHVSQLNAPTKITSEQRAKEIIDVLNKIGEWHGEVKNIRKDGTTFYCHADVSTFNHSTYGKVFIAIHINVTDQVITREKLKEAQMLLKSSIESSKELLTKQKIAENSLKKSEEKFKELSELSPAAISIQTTKRYLYVNKAWEELTGFTKEEALNLSPMHIVHPNFVDEIRKRSESRLKDEPVLKKYDLKILTKSKEVKWVDISFSVFEYENQTVSLGVCNDITELMNAKDALLKSEKELKDSNTTKNKFLSIIAHDLRNPFSNILWLANYLKTEYGNLSDEERREYIDAISVSSNQTFILLENLLNWAKAQQGGIKIQKTNLNLNEIINNAFEPYMHNANQKEIVVSNSILNDINVMADEYTIMTVLRNILCNAIKFTPNGGNIYLKAFNSNGEITIEISDTGVGMEKNTIEKLFLLDESFSTPGTNDEQGSGLGLILCKDFVKLNGGSISVQSKKGKGSKFSICLPK